MHNSHWHLQDKQMLYDLKGRRRPVKYRPNRNKVLQQFKFHILTKINKRLAWESKNKNNCIKISLRFVGQDPWLKKQDVSFLPAGKSSL